MALALIVGVGTWALRYLPLRLSWTSGTRDELTPDHEHGIAPGRRAGVEGAIERFLGATGVAAVAALAAVAILPYLQESLALGSAIAEADAAIAGSRSLSRVVPLLVGVLATVMAFLPRRSVGAGTLVGAAAYGLSLWLFGGA